MANNVFANGREISCKSGSGKSIAAFPDVCMTPPENPATPPGVPVPYPNTGNTNDCTSGSTTVKVTNKEAMLKNKSYFKKSMGDEAGSAAKKGVVTSVNRGKVYFTAWSMDVKIEGENAVRHLDMTTHNHGSGPNAAIQVFMDSIKLSDTVQKKCAKTYQKFKAHRHRHGKKTCRPRGGKDESHHPVMDACFQSSRSPPVPYYTVPKYKSRSVPAICLPKKKHQKITNDQCAWARGLKKRPTYRELRAQEKKNLKKNLGMSETEAECIMKAVDAVMEKEFNVKRNTVLRSPG